jgi:hypothetical protein
MGVLSGRIADVADVLRAKDESDVSPKEVAESSF